ncbi:hypothetical protein D3C80_1980860 [compost metagenome]
MLPLSAFTIQRATASRLERAHELAQVAWPKLDQPMQMIRHQNPGQRAATPLLITAPQLLDSCTRKYEIREKREAMARDGG